METILTAVWRTEAGRDASKSSGNGNGVKGAHSEEELAEWLDWK